MWQRRVAVAAAVTIAGRPIRLVSAHLDPRGPAGYKWLGAAGRGLQAAHLLADVEDPTVVLGADLNLGRGRAEFRLLPKQYRVIASEAAHQVLRALPDKLPAKVTQAQEKGRTRGRAGGGRRTVGRKTHAGIP